MHRRRRFLVATVLLAAFGSAHPAFAQPARTSSRDAALRALAGRLHLPLIDEAVAIFSRQLRRALPGEFVGAVGRNIDLGPQWKRGNPYFDEAVGRLDGALAAEEARGGPLLKLDRDDLLDAVNVPWSEADIAFVDQTLDTPLGAEAERAIDAKAAQQAIATLERRIAGAPGQGVAEAFADLDARAQSQFADAFLTLVAMKATDPERSRRLQRLIDEVTLAPSDAIGERVAQRLSQRLLDAATAQLPNVLGAIAGFRMGS